MRTLNLLLIAMVSLMLTACFSETVGNEVLTPEIPEVTNPESNNPNANFTTRLGGWEMDNAYIVSQTIDNGEKELHHIIVTKLDVEEGGMLRGISPAITITIEAPTGELEGTYYTTATEGHRAFEVREYRGLDFSESRNSIDVGYRNGNLTISKQGEEYALSFEFTDPLYSIGLRGTYEGAMETVSAGTSAPPTAAAFQGNNTFVRGVDAFEFNHAYLVAENVTANQNTTLRHRLYLTENEIEVGEQLEGVSNVFMLVISGKKANEYASGTYQENGNGLDYLSFLRPTISSTYYCTDYNFVTRSATDDEETEGETLILEEGGEIMVRFTGRTRGGIVAEGMYRGPLTVVD